MEICFLFLKQFQISIVKDGSHHVCSYMFIILCHIHSPFLQPSSHFLPAAGDSPFISRWSLLLSDDICTILYWVSCFSSGSLFQFHDLQTHTHINTYVILNPGFSNFMTYKHTHTIHIYVILNLGSAYERKWLYPFSCKCYNLIFPYGCIQFFCMYVLPLSVFE